MSGRKASRVLALAMAFPPLAWFTYQQGLGAVVRVKCDAGGAGTGLIWGVLALAACLGAAEAGRRASASARDDAGEETRRLLVVLVLSSAALFGLAILYQMAATALVPSCAR